MALRVTVIITALGIGGAEHALLKLLSRIDREKFHVSVIALGLEDALLPHYRAAGIEPIMLRMRPGRWPLKTARRLLAAVKQCEPDLIQGWMYHGNLGASFSAGRLGKRVVTCWSVRDTPDAAHGHSLFTRAVIRLSGWYARRANVIFNVSGASAAYCTEHLGWPADRTEVLPNGIDTELFHPDALARRTAREALCLGSQPTIGLVARWSPVKNHTLFLDAAALFFRRNPDARFVLIGSGLDSDNLALREMLAQRGLTDVTLLLGARHDLHALYPAMDIVALTSRSEGFPNVLVEAMACGVPVTSTDVGDARIIVGKGGCILPPNAVSFADIWSCWMADQSLLQRLGEEARDHVCREYALDNIVRRLEDRYEALVSLQADADLPL